jgi:hypothetical protein
MSRQLQVPATSTDSFCNAVVIARLDDSDLDSDSESKSESESGFRAQKCGSDIDVGEKVMFRDSFTLDCLFARPEA